MAETTRDTSQQPTTNKPGSLEEIAQFLWSLLDDIDTGSDIAKGDNVVYRELVERIQCRRFEVGSTDGYTVQLAASPIPPSASPEPSGASQGEGTLERFGHHSDLSTDFCCEIDMLEGWAYDIKTGARSQWPFWSRLSRLLAFARSPDAGGLDEIGMRAKPVVFELETRLTAPPVTGDQP